MTAERDELPIEPASLEREAYAWVVRFISGEAGRDDIAALKEWAARSPNHLAAFAQSRETLKTIDLVGKQLAAANGALSRLPIAADLRASAQPHLGRRAFLGSALAASAAGAAYCIVRPPLDLWPSLAELTADYRTDTGEQRQIQLAGNIAIDMNTRTSIALRSSQEKAERIELITGEAMISASPGAMPVTVLAGDGAILASNAGFNVRCDDRTVCVTCLRGTVAIERLGTRLPLAQGQQIAYSDQGFGAPSAVDSASVTAWRDGVIIFEAAPITQVIAEVNRYRRGRIVLTNAALGRERLNARFKIANIDRVIEQIEQVFGAHATQLPGGLTLLG